MKVYRLNSDYNHFQSLAPVKGADVSIIINLFDGKPIKRLWNPIEVQIFEGEEGEEEEEIGKSEGDFPLFGGQPVFTKNAVETIEDLLTPNGEILPLIFEQKTDKYFIFNVTKISDALDVNQSKVRRYTTGNIMCIDKFEFNPHKLDGAVIFKIPQLVKAYVFVTDLFLERVEQADLTGFDFVQVWNSVK